MAVAVTVALAGPKEVEGLLLALLLIAAVLPCVGRGLPLLTAGKILHIIDGAACCRCGGLAKPLPDDADRHYWTSSVE